MDTNEANNLFGHSTIDELKKIQMWLPSWEHSS